MLAVVVGGPRNVGVLPAAKARRVGAAPLPAAPAGAASAPAMSPAAASPSVTTPAVQLRCAPPATLRAAGLLAALLLALPAVAGAKDYGCLESSFASCLQDGRFQVVADYDHEGKRNGARMRDALVGDAASLFYFFTFDNPELMVKVVDGCALNGRYWVFGSAATDLDYRVTVEDMATGREKRYERNRSNPLIGDVVSFPCAIPEGAAARASAKSGSAGAAGLHGESALLDVGPLLPDRALCGGTLVLDGLPGLAEEASRADVGPAVLRRASTDKLHVIDIAFVYAGSITDTAKLRMKVDAAVARANVIFLRSGVPAALRTVAVQPDRRYGISLDGVDLGAAIGELYDVVPEVRSDNGADLMYALTNKVDRPCGSAVVRGRPPFDTRRASLGAIVASPESPICFGDNGVLAHEVGHNLGLKHESDEPLPDGFIAPYAKGFEAKNVRDQLYGTVMASWMGNYSRFSTYPAHHDGLPMGDELANAAEALLYTVEDASNYSPTKVPDPAPDHECAEGPTRSCMQKGRFLVEARVSYVDAAGTPVSDAPARVEDVGLGDTSSLFHFFDRSNPELLVKVLDGCGVNGKYWVFGSAATDLDYSVLVTDNATGVTLPYRRNGANPLINDAEAFPCWP